MINMISNNKLLLINYLIIIIQYYPFVLNRILNEWSNIFKRLIEMTILILINSILNVK